MTATGPGGVGMRRVEFQNVADLAGDMLPMLALTDGIEVTAHVNMVGGVNPQQRALNFAMKVHELTHASIVPDGNRYTVGGFDISWED